MTEPYKPLLLESDDEESVLSHAKTPLPKIRSNPAILLQECMSNVESASCQDMLRRSITVSRKFSTEGCEDYQYSREKVKRLVEQLSQTVELSMPAHASEIVTDWQKTTPEVLLIKGLLKAGRGDYETSIERYKQALILSDLRSQEHTTTKQFRINTLNQIGIALCLIKDFDEAERYFQFALEGYANDQDLISYIISKYSELALDAGFDFVENSPIERFQTELNQLKRKEHERVGRGQSLSEAAVNADDLTKGGRVGATEPAMGGDELGLTWFPGSKEELLDYSAAYIQMMIMGAEMGHHQRSIYRIPYQRARYQSPV